MTFEIRNPAAPNEIVASYEEIHLNELAKKYLTHEDLLFTRLHTKYHETRD